MSEDISTSSWGEELEHVDWQVEPFHSNSDENEGEGESYGEPDFPIILEEYKSLLSSSNARHEPPWWTHRRLLIKFLFDADAVRHRDWLVNLLSPEQLLDNIDLVLLSKVVSVLEGEDIEVGTGITPPAYEKVYNGCTAEGFAPPAFFIEHKLLEKHFQDTLRMLVFVATHAVKSGAFMDAERRLKPLKRIQNFIRANVVFSDDPERFSFKSNNSNPVGNGRSLPDGAGAGAGAGAAGNLPVELLALIFSYLPEAQTQRIVASVSLVNKSWLAAAQEVLYTRPTLSSDQSAYNFFLGVRLNSQYGMIGWRNSKSYVTNICMPARFTFLTIGVFCSLRTLTLNEFDDFELMRPLVDYPPPHLRQIKLHFFSTDLFDIDQEVWNPAKVEAFFAQLTAIHWSFGDNSWRFIPAEPTGRILLDPLVGCGHPGLQVIKFPGISKRDHSWLERFFSRCGPDLVAVDLSGLDSLKAPTLDALSQSFPNIHAFILHAHRVDAAGWDRFFKRYGPKLVYLSISDHHLMDLIRQYCLRLEYLICHVLWKRTDVQVQDFIRFVENRGDGLKGLVVRGLGSSVSGELLGAVADGCGSLRYLTLDLMGVVIDAGGAGESDDEGPDGGGVGVVGISTFEDLGKNLKALLQKCSCLRKLYLSQQHLKCLRKSDIAAKFGNIMGSRCWEDEVRKFFFERNM
ncbi:hypothetical protein HK102_013639 [Quaeritorhiza haematococci]|nr:hypothetical protein HK102_013639 [Quaeritorhiza haematococci]